MALQYSATPQINDHWKVVTDKVIDCVLDDSPSDEILAQYLGKDVQNEYRVQTFKCAMKLLFWLHKIFRMYLRFECRSKYFLYFRIIQIQQEE